MSGQTGPTEPDEKAAKGEAEGGDRAGVDSADMPEPTSSGTSASVERPLAKSQKTDHVEAEAAPRGAYHVALPSFEGPLDLLLHLIQQHELDIKDIPILFVSEKYVEYIMLMQELNIDLASEYLVMAATLAHIKSKMLLPKPPVDQDDELGEELDPRSELVRRLLEYQKYKDAAQNLGESPVLGRDVFLRGAPAPMVDGPAPLAQVGVFKLFDAFQRLLTRTKQKAEHLIDVDRISISERIIELSDLLRGRGRVPFSQIFGEDKTRADLIVSFLAVLEMTRLRMMEVTQDDPREELFIELTITEEHDEYLKKVPESDDPLAVLAELVGEGDLASTPNQDSSSDGAEPPKESDESSSEGNEPSNEFDAPSGEKEGSSSGGVEPSSGTDESSDENDASHGDCDEPSAESNMASSSGDEPSAESDNMAPGNSDELSTDGDASSGEIEELSGDGAELSIESDESEASVADEGLSSEHESSDWAPLEEPK